MRHPGLGRIAMVGIGDQMACSHRAKVRCDSCTCVHACGTSPPSFTRVLCHTSRESRPSFSHLSLGALVWSVAFFMIPTLASPSSSSSSSSSYSYSSFPPLLPL
ncbi:hypothetical protein M433DRAFT_147228 [Acidomyces richmondensis BFW]|nr:hypothetical protein M433DRAFT_147228 [Acidomyces richmondensis BFW]